MTENKDVLAKQVGYWTRERDRLNDLIAYATGRHPAEAQQSEAVAWRHEDDASRVISDVQKSQALRDGGASASSVRPYSIALAPAPSNRGGEAESEPDGIYLLSLIQECAPVIGHKAGDISAEEVLHTLKQRASQSAEPVARSYGLAAKRIDEIAAAYFHQDDTELSDVKTAIRTALYEASIAPAPAQGTQEPACYQVQINGTGEWENSSKETYDWYEARPNLGHRIRKLYAAPTPNASPAVLTDARIEQIASLNGLNMRAYLGLDRDVFFRVIRAALAASQANKEKK